MLATSPTCLSGQCSVHSEGASSKLPLTSRHATPLAVTSRLCFDAVRMFPNISNGIPAAAGSWDSQDFFGGSDIDDIGDLNTDELSHLLAITSSPPAFKSSSPPTTPCHIPVQTEPMNVRTYSKYKVAPPLHRYIFPIEIEGLAHMFSVLQHKEEYQSMSSSKLAQNARNTMFRRHS